MCWNDVNLLCGDSTGVLNFKLTVMLAGLKDQLKGCLSVERLQGGILGDAGKPKGVVVSTSGIIFW